MEIKSDTVKHLRHLDLGRLLSHEILGHGVTGVAENGYLKITAYSDQIIRVQISDSDLFDELSYAVIAEPGQVELSITDKDSSILIETDVLTVELKKDPVRLVFYNRQG